MIGAGTRGLRNNNPLNIRHVERNKWLGLDDPPSDGAFCRFTSADYGIRAACVLLMRYYDVDGLDSVASIVKKWAPSTENNTSAYIASVATQMQVGPAQKLDLHDRDTMRALVAAMARHETGARINDTALNKGVALAGFAAPMLVTSVMYTPTMLAATATAAPAIAVGVGAIIDGLAGNAEIISGLVTAIGGPVAGGIAVGTITAITWGWSLYNRIRVRQDTGV